MKQSLFFFGILFPIRFRLTARVMLEHLICWESPELHWPGPEIWLASTPASCLSDLLVCTFMRHFDSLTIMTILESLSRAGTCSIPRMPLDLLDWDSSWDEPWYEAGPFMSEKETVRCLSSVSVMCLCLQQLLRLECRLNWNAHESCLLPPSSLR